MKSFITVFLFVVLSCFSILAEAQPSAKVDSPIYNIVLKARTTSAVNYRERDSTKIDFRGTPLLPSARGVATVKSNRGRTAIEAEFEKLDAATQFGPEYLTYILWAVTPAGRATSLGEVVLNGNKARLEAATDLQTFAMIVTAEPYFAVTQPSDVVVMENVVRPGTAGKIELVDAKYELLPRGQYTLNVGSGAFERRVFDPRVPLALYQAQNAVLLTRLTGADRYAPDIYQKATRLLQQAENAQAKKSNQRDVAVLARQAVQAAEDARLITVKRQAEEGLARERQAATEAEERAKAEAQEASRRAEAEASQRAEAERNAQRQAERQQIERERLDADRAKLEAESAAQRAAREKAEADAARSALADAQRQRVIQEGQAAAERDARARLELEAQKRAVAEAQARTEAQRLTQAETDRQREEQSRREAERAAQTQADQQRLAEARTQAERAAQTQAEQQRLAEARTQAERAKQEAETAAQKAAQQKTEIEEARARLAQERQAAVERELREKTEAERQRSEAVRLESERARLQAESAAERALREKAEAEAARATAVAQQQAAELEAEKARQAATEAQRRQGEAEQEHAEVRADLQQRLNAILETRATDRGLIVNMADVVFGSGQHTLLAGAREKLAKIAGLLLSQPELRLTIEGHTDAVGSDVTNQQLSERRANSVREFLIQQGIPGESIAAHGFGEAQPLTTNDTPEGRQQNRRVEIVVAGGDLGKDG